MRCENDAFRHSGNIPLSEANPFSAGAEEISFRDGDGEFGLEVVKDRALVFCSCFKFCCSAITPAKVEAALGLPFSVTGDSYESLASCASDAVFVRFERPISILFADMK